jgi:pimeloyl-ACP methyl ester carboxylesterase
MSRWRVVVGCLALVAALFMWPDRSRGRTQDHIGSKGATHLFVLLGLGNNSPGLSELGSRIAQQGVQTTIANYGEWQPLAREAIREYKYDRVRSIMIIGHSLGGSAAAEMAAELGRSGIPVELVVMLDPVGGSAIPYNVRRSVSIRPTRGEDHFSVIAAHEQEIINYVLGAKESGRISRRP